MEIVIKIEENKATLITEVRGVEVTYGMEKERPGVWVQCTEENIDGYYDDGILTDDEADALEDIDLPGLQKAFSWY